MLDHIDERRSWQAKDAIQLHDFFGLPSDTGAMARALPNTTRLPQRSIRLVLQNLVLWVDNSAGSSDVDGSSGVFGHGTTLEGLRVTGKYRNRSIGEIVRGAGAVGWGILSFSKRSGNPSPGLKDLYLKDNARI